MKRFMILLAVSLVLLAIAKGSELRLGDDGSAVLALNSAVDEVLGVRLQGLVTSAG